MKTINTSNAPKAIGPYSQGVDYNQLIFTSGQIPLDPKTNKLIKNNFKQELKQVLNNLDAILIKGGSSLKNVIKLTVFLTDLSNFSELNEVFNLYFKDFQPARSAVQVAALPLGANIEIEAIAGKNN